MLSTRFLTQFARFAGYALLALSMAMVSKADVAVPPQVLNPQTAAEAWNILRLATANVARLIQEKRVTEVPVQIALCSAPLRTLVNTVTPSEGRPELQKLTARGQAFINTIASAGMAGNIAAVEHNFADFQNVLKTAAELFDSKQVSAEISVCPMHPDCLSADPAPPCAKCGMHLLTRRIPYSFIYIRPGQPSLAIRAKADAPLEAGRLAKVEVQIATLDGRPVLPDDLMVMHTERIHLLIVDTSLQDYHHEHPKPTETPGTYAFSFTPNKSASYRIFADLVPMTTSLQEYPFTDLPGVGPGTSVVQEPNTLTASAGGLTFTLSFPGLIGEGLRAGQIHNMGIAVSDADGQPVRRLEPVMNAFAHVVGFHEDYSTVVHLHPAGGDILRDDVRGGPAMSFKFFPPKHGFVRLYCQVQVDGKMIFAPFNVRVLP